MHLFAAPQICKKFYSSMGVEELYLKLGLYLLEIELGNVSITTRISK
jgi:hypothetical protein